MKKKKHYYAEHMCIACNEFFIDKFQAARKDEHKSFCPDCRKGNKARKKTYSGRVACVNCGLNVVGALLDNTDYICNRCYSEYDGYRDVVGLTNDEVQSMWRGLRLISECRANRWDSQKPTIVEMNILANKISVDYEKSNKRIEKVIKKLQQEIDFAHEQAIREDVDRRKCAYRFRYVLKNSAKNDRYTSKRNISFLYVFIQEDIGFVKFGITNQFNSRVAAHMNSYMGKIKFLFILCIKNAPEIEKELISHYGGEKIPIEMTEDLLNRIEVMCG